MKIRTTLICLAVFLVLLAAVLFFESRSKKSEETEGKLVDLNSEDVQTIVFKKDQETLTFQKDEKAEWMITTPLEAKADNSEVNQLAEDFAQLRAERVVEEQPADLSKYGFPGKEIHLSLRGNAQPVTVLIGMENPLDQTFFAKRQDESRVVLTPSHLKNQLEKGIFDFRLKEIFRYETDNVKSIALRTKDVNWKAARKEEDWYFSTPFKPLAKKFEINSLLSSLSDLKAKEFLSEAKNPEELNTFGLNNPAFEVILSSPETNQEVTFYLNKNGDKVCATTSLSSKIIAVEDSIVSTLEKDMNELREKKVASFFSWEVSKLHLQKGTLNLTAAKDTDGNWHFEDADQKEADKSKIETFMRKIENLEAESFIDAPQELKDYGLDNPQAEIMFWVNENEEKTSEVNICVGSIDQSTKKTVLKNTRFSYLFRVDSSFLDEFPQSPKDWEKEETAKAVKENK